MANLLGSYSPNDVIVTVGGVPVSGYAPDTFVSVEYNTDAATLVEGADGSPAMAFKRGQRGGSITLTLLQTSLSNNYLSALLFSQKNGANSATTFAISVRNAQGGEMHTISRGAIGKEPVAGNGPEVGTREWRFIGQLDSTFAGMEV